MGRKLALIFNHEFTEDQTRDAYVSLGVESIESMPPWLADIWADIPPNRKELRDYLTPIENWLSENFQHGDHVLIQGDFGACYLLADFTIRNGFIPVYSTTARAAVQNILPDGTVALTHRFRHVMFRKYGD